MSIASKGKKFQRLAGKINKKLGLNDRRVVLQTLTTPDPALFDPDVSDAPERDELVALTTLEFPAFGKHTVAFLSATMIMLSQGKYLKGDVLITFPGGQKDAFDNEVLEPAIRAINQVVIGEPGSEEIYDEIVNPPQPKDKDAIFMGVVVEWSIVARKTSGR